ELEVMEKRETAEAVLTQAQSRLAAATARRDTVETARDEALRQIAQEEEFRAAGRRPLVADLPADLIALYERIREASGGDRAAVRAAPPDEVVRCEECRRSLVRTAESGL